MDEGISSFMDWVGAGAGVSWDLSAGLAFHLLVQEMEVWADTLSVSGLYTASQH